MSKVKINKNQNIIFAFSLILLGILFRTVWHLGPNVEFITSAALLSGAYLGKKWAVIVPLLIIALSDLLIGNSNIFLFTWSAYIMVGLGGYYIQKFKVQSSKFKVMKATFLGIIASFWFYLWTNFGVWLLDSWGMFAKTIYGLLDAYILGLPFLKYNLLGNIIMVPLSFIIVETVKNLNLVPFNQFKQVIKSKKSV